MTDSVVGVRKQREDGLRTRKAILLEAVSLATVEGLEGLSIGGLAKSLGISKSGLYAHFGSKQELQLATIDEAERIFDLEVIDPSEKAPEGLGQLLAVCDLFFDHLQRHTFPGGCFFASAVLEMGTRPGPVKERVGDFQQRFIGLVFGYGAKAQKLGQLAADEDLMILVFDINGIILAANTSFVMSDDPATLDVARRAVRRRLGVHATDPPSR
ncbi:MAG TPA: TetR/AcrR family transcriptional regulator [Acidimicrobiales bacterium]|jgi:AcrR family transcriptional regulator|nr:TetR/AcrR family transcriptional regulator [Acidimicrobiales bacterium]